MTVSKKLSVLWLLILGFFGGHVSDFTLKEVVGHEVVYLEDPVGMFGGGTGFVVVAPSGRRYILTNRHVCQLAIGGYLAVRHGDNDKGTLRKVIQKSLAHDLCLVQPLQEDLHGGLEVAAAPASAFERVTAVGHPDLLPMVQEDGQVIGEKFFKVIYTCEPSQVPDENGNCVLEYKGILITNKIRPGNSGSPLVNSKGQVVGVIFAGNDVYGIAVPLRFVQKFLAGR